jgi:cystathionine gamma-synthase
MHARSPDTSHPVLVRIAQFLIQASSSPTSLSQTSGAKDSSIELHIVFFPIDSAPLAKQFWQHTGNGISSRMAERCLSLLPSQDVPSAQVTPGHGIDSPPMAAGAWNKSRNRHYDGLKKGSHITSASPEGVSLSSGKDEVPDDVADYLEEHYGRNLPISAASLAKRALRRRVAGVMVHDEIPLSDSEVRRGPCVTEEDVYFYPTGMSAIWHSHQLALATLPPAKSVCFG